LASLYGKVIGKNLGRASFNRKSEVLVHFLSLKSDLRTASPFAVILKDVISGPFNYVKQNGYLEILIGCIWRNGGGWGWGDSCPPVTFDY